MGQIDSFKKVLELEANRTDSYRGVLEDAKAARAVEGKGDEKKKKAPKKIGGKSLEPPSSSRTSISVSRRTFARLDSYYFWLKTCAGASFPSFSAIYCISVLCFV